MVPKGTEHKPVAEQDAVVLLLSPLAPLIQGNTGGPFTRGGRTGTLNFFLIIAFVVTTGYIWENLKNAPMQVPALHLVVKLLGASLCFLLLSRSEIILAQEADSAAANDKKLHFGSGITMLLSSITWMEPPPVSNLLCMLSAEHPH